MIDDTDAQTVNFHYPPSLPAADYQGMAYITPRVKLELGARGDPWPAEHKIIRPYAADSRPLLVVRMPHAVTSRRFNSV